MRTELLVNEERVRLVLDLLVDTGDGFTHLLHRSLEVFLRHADRLLLELLHDCLVDE